eukprot:1181464-Prorocentrum_minimum.AAC.2
MTLLECGARIDGANKSGYTALMAAAQFGQAEAMAVLLERGATKRRQVRTPLRVTPLRVTPRTPNTPQAGLKNCRDRLTSSSAWCAQPPGDPRRLDGRVLRRLTGHPRAHLTPFRGGARVPGVPGDAAAARHPGGPRGLRRGDGADHRDAARGPEGDRRAAAARRAHRPREQDQGGHRAHGGGRREPDAGGGGAGHVRRAARLRERDGRDGADPRGARRPRQLHLKSHQERRRGGHPGDGRVQDGAHLRERGAGEK